MMIRESRIPYSNHWSDSDSVEYCERFKCELDRVRSEIYLTCLGRYNLSGLSTSKRAPNPDGPSTIGQCLVGWPKTELLLSLRSRK